MEIFDYIQIDWSGIYIFFLLLLVCVIFYYLSFYYKPSFVVPLKYLIKNRYILEKTLAGSIIFLVLLLPFSISIKLGEERISEKIGNIQFLFQVSLSMTTTDVEPSRFTAAKDAVYDFVGELEGYNIGFVIFSSIPVNWMPFSPEIEAIQSKLEDFNLAEFPPTREFVGTAMGDAIYYGVDNILRNYGEKQHPGDIVVVTDGDTNQGSDPLQAAEYAARNGISVYSITLGREDTTVGTDSFGSPVVATFDHNLLENMAEVSGGKAYHITSEEDLSQAVDTITNEISLNQQYEYKPNWIDLNRIIYVLLSFLLTLQIFIKLYIVKMNK